MTGDTSTDSSAGTDAADRISVVIPTRNRRPLLERLLGQLLRPSVADAHEVIVIDEASSDDTPELLDRLAGEGRLIAIRNDPPLRLAEARNRGLAAATGRYIGWIDDDDLTAPDRLIRQREGLLATGLRWSCAAKVDINDELEVIGARRCPSPDDFLRQILAFNCVPAAAQGLLVERTLAEELGGYERAMHAAEDWDFCIRLAYHGPPHFLDEPLVGYRTGYASMSTDTALMDETIATVFHRHGDMLEKHGVERDWASVHQSLLSADLLKSRRAAVRRSLRLLDADPGLRNAARVLAVAASPSRVAAASARRRREQVPDDWHRMARSWLDDVRHDIDDALAIAPDSDRS